MLLAFFGIVPLTCKIFAGISFIITMFYYYNIISVLEQVTDIKPFQVWVGVLSHIATMVATYFMGNHVIFSILLVGSGIARAVTGIYAIDAQIKSLCKGLDENILRLALEEQAAQAAQE